jgi:hypothetical protein
VEGGGEVRVAGDGGEPAGGGLGVGEVGVDLLPPGDDLLGVGGPVLGLRVVRLEPDDQQDEGGLEQEGEEDEKQPLLGNGQVHGRAFGVAGAGGLCGLTLS